MFNTLILLAFLVILFLKKARQFYQPPFLAQSPAQL